MWLSKILTAFSAASVSVKLREIQIDEGHDQPYHAPVCTSLLCSCDVSKLCIVDYFCKNNKF